MGRGLLERWGLIEDLRELDITRVIWASLSLRGAIYFPTDDVSRHNLKKERYIVYIYYKTS